MRYGSLFSGAGGLDLAIESVFGATCAWHCELEVLTDDEGRQRPNAAVKVLAHRWPGVPNLDDISAVDWSTVEPVDILCGGFPCQDISCAGKRAGMGEGTRSGLWSEFARAIRELRPQFVVAENVRNLLNVEANRTLEHDTATVGDGPGRPVLRALGAVLGDLCDLGYDAQWVTVAASDVGAPHRRERVFILATAADAGGAAARGGREWIAGGNTGLTPAPVDLLPTPSAADGGGGHLSRSGDRSCELLLPGIARAYGNGEMLPTPRRSDGDGGPNPLSRAERMDDVETRIIRCGGQWGKYEPAIQRWESVTTPAPSPTEPNTKGNHRLAAAFSEWMQGFRNGWITGVPGISRNDQLRIIGNSVCPQQAVAALRQLLSFVGYGVAA